MDLPRPRQAHPRASRRAPHQQGRRLCQRSRVSPLPRRTAAPPAVHKQALPHSAPLRLPNKALALPHHRVLPRRRPRRTVNQRGTRRQRPRHPQNNSRARARSRLYPLRRFRPPRHRTRQRPHRHRRPHRNGRLRHHKAPRRGPLPRHDLLRRRHRRVPKPRNEGREGQARLRHLGRPLVLRNPRLHRPRRQATRRHKSPHFLQVHPRGRARPRHRTPRGGPPPAPRLRRLRPARAPGPRVLRRPQVGRRQAQGDPQGQPPRIHLRSARKKTLQHGPAHALQRLQHQHRHRRPRRGAGAGRHRTQQLSQGHRRHAEAEGRAARASGVGRGRRWRRLGRGSDAVARYEGGEDGDRVADRRRFLFESPGHKSEEAGGVRRAMR
mmetsp:Transcript_15641/g.42067  ORF Transcript_15641/g.42067 Transcript_15641/m.42067 type:complete len:381 (-) Transcript_15641:208-1350(-)